MRKVKQKSIGYTLAFFLGALGIHAFYYQKYIRGAIYFAVCFFIPPLIQVMLIVGWADMFFINKWQREYESGDLPKDIDRVNAFYKKHILQKVQKNEKINNFITKIKPKIHRRPGLPIYDETQNIFEKYEHIETPNYILEDIKKILNNNRKVHHSRDVKNRIFMSSNEVELIKTSYMYRNRSHSKIREKPLHAYWTTFKDLNYNQLMWYFYWRKQALNKNYIDVDMSYIILFVYELINYSFNTKAAFNISVMVTLYEKYKVRHPKLKNYLPRWIADMLYEVGEAELAREWDSEEKVKPKLYTILEEEFPLGEVTMKTWKEYFVNHRETAYFIENRSNVYGVFKTGMELLENLYKEKNIKPIEKWFEKHDDRVIRQLYSTAVIGRDIDAVHVPITTIRPTKALMDEVTAMFKLSENISREMRGFNRKVIVEENALLHNIKEKMENHFLDKRVVDGGQEQDKNINSQNDRFKLVEKNEPKSAKGSTIPDPILNENNAEEQILSFDDTLIKNNEKELRALADAFEELFKDKTEEVSENLENVPETESLDSKIEEEQTTGFNAGELGSLFDSDQDDDLDGFFAALSLEEVAFIELFKESHERVVEEKVAQEFVKEKGMMLGVFLSGINEKANEYLGDVLLESTSSEINLIEEFESILTLVGESNNNEHKHA